MPCAQGADDDAARRRTHSLLMPAGSEMGASESDAIPCSEQSTVLVSSTQVYPQYVVVQLPSHPEHGHAVASSAPDDSDHVQKRMVPSYEHVTSWRERGSMRMDGTQWS